MRLGWWRDGFTLVETIAALLLFSIGGLALASTAGLIGRQLAVNGQRERAAKVAASRLEMLRADCAGATSGSQTVGGIESEWSVSVAGPRVSVVETVKYATWSGSRADTYRLVVACR